MEPGEPDTQRRKQVPLAREAVDNLPALWVAVERSLHLRAARVAVEHSLHRIRSAGFAEVGRNLFPTRSAGFAEVGSNLGLRLWQVPLEEVGGW